MTDDEIWVAVADAIKMETDNLTMTLSPSMTASDIPGWDSLAHIRIFLSLDASLHTTIDVQKTYEAAKIADLIPIVRTALNNSTR